MSRTLAAGGPAIGTSVVRDSGPMVLAATRAAATRLQARWRGYRERHQISDEEFDSWLYGDSSCNSSNGDKTVAAIAPNDVGQVDKPESNATAAADGSADVANHNMRAHWARSYPLPDERGGGDAALHQHAQADNAAAPTALRKLHTDNDDASGVAGTVVNSSLMRPAQTTETLGSTGDKSAAAVAIQAAVRGAMVRSAFKWLLQVASDVGDASVAAQIIQAAWRKLAYDPVGRIVKATAWYEVVYGVGAVQTSTAAAITQLVGRQMLHGSDYEDVEDLYWEHDRIAALGVISARKAATIHLPAVALHDRTFMNGLLISREWSDAGLNEASLVKGGHIVLFPDAFALRISSMVRLFRWRRMATRIQAAARDLIARRHAPLHEPAAVLQAAVRGRLVRRRWRKTFVYWHETCKDLLGDVPPRERSASHYARCWRLRADEMVYAAIDEDGDEYDYLGDLIDDAVDAAVVEAREAAAVLSIQAAARGWRVRSAIHDKDLKESSDKIYLHPLHDDIFAVLVFDRRSGVEYDRLPTEGRGVRFYELQGRSDLNNTTGVVVAWLGEKDRWAVRCGKNGDGELVCVKASNLVALDDEPPPAAEKKVAKNAKQRRAQEERAAAAKDKFDRLKRTYVIMKNGDVFDFGLSQNDKYPSTWTPLAGPKIVAKDIKERVGRPNSRALPLWLEAERIERQQRAG